jgi:hypothetical protein
MEKEAVRITSVIVCILANYQPFEADNRAE